jgi:glutamate-1-semialdehyde 2,1-aminomutase
MAPSTAFTPDEKTHSIPERPLKHANDEHDILAAAQDRFVQRNQRSLELHQKALKSLPGGNTRTILHTAPFPLCMKSGKGYQVTDEDGHT